MRINIGRTTLAAAVIALAWSVSAQALPRRGGIIVAPRIYAPFGYDPFWGPSWGPFWGPYPYAAYPGVYRTADVRIEVEPKQTEVYVDGYYAGVADNFDGVFKRLHTTPGGHAITLHLEGYRTVTENIYVRPDSTYKVRDTMDKLGAGEVSAPPPLPVRRMRTAAPAAPAPPSQG